MAPPEPVPVGWDKVQQPEVGVLKVDQREQIRRAYFIEGKSIRQIALEGHHHRRTVRPLCGMPARLVIPTDSPGPGPSWVPLSISSTSGWPRT